MSVRASTMRSLANHNGQRHKIDVSHHDNALQDGHTGDWTQGLPHAKRMWYHYTMCPWRKFMGWLHMVKKATPAEKQMKIVLNSKLKTIVYLSRSWLPIRNKRFFGGACANKQTQSISGLTNWYHFLFVCMIHNGHTGDWTQSLPHAERMWYHYTMCPACEILAVPPGEFGPR